MSGKKISCKKEKIAHKKYDSFTKSKEILRTT
jgi:hypothetical protein